MGDGIKKLKIGNIIAKKANKTVTTPSTCWKTLNNSLDSNFSMKACVSARTIGANLWEVEPQFDFSKNHPDDDDDDDDHHHHHNGGLRNQPRRRHPPPETETSLRRNIKEVASKSHVPAEENDQDLRQVTPYAPGVTATGYSLKTSAHLLKVLDRIWNLEEQHMSNVTLIKSLKHDLDISRAQIKTLVEERKNDHQEINELKKSTHERKKKALQSTSHEISDVKSSFMREKKAQILLESLCDEFAKGIRDYEQKVRILQQNRSRKDPIMIKNEPDRLILHVSEAWLDERAFSGKTSISEDLRYEIEMFLKAKNKVFRGINFENEETVENHEEIKLYGGITESSPVSGPAEVGPRDREEVRKNTLMAKLIEARLESQFSKSRTVRKPKLL
ncbi:uncharacterized protein At5g41620-like [Rutidosis leptorrhynchoides]|uniref:uncharacterized protein At5g41620-like n=1 Tax=Rutidosis leptorrhynchoides TaxID=125765 RepID=UPI003A99E989